MSSFLTGSFKSSAAIDPADRLHRRDLTSRGLEGKPNHSAFNRCCLVAQAVTRPPLLLQLAADPEQKRGSRPNLTPTCPGLRGSRADADRPLMSICLLTCG